MPKVDNWWARYCRTQIDSLTIQRYALERTRDFYPKYKYRLYLAIIDLKIVTWESIMPTGKIQF